MITQVVVDYDPKTPVAEKVPPIMQELPNAFAKVFAEFDRTKPQPDLISVRPMHRLEQGVNLPDLTISVTAEKTDRRMAFDTQLTDLLVGALAKVLSSKSLKLNPETTVNLYLELAVGGLRRVSFGE